jgi:hypothetical protein
MANRTEPLHKWQMPSNNMIGLPFAMAASAISSFSGCARVMRQRYPLTRAVGRSFASWRQGLLYCGKAR